jgi:hypothetical protein
VECVDEGHLRCWWPPLGQGRAGWDMFLWEGTCERGWAGSDHLLFFCPEVTSMHLPLCGPRDGSKVSLLKILEGFLCAPIASRGNFRLLLFPQANPAVCSHRHAMCLSLSRVICHTDALAHTPPSGSPPPPHLLLPVPTCPLWAKCSWHPPCSVRAPHHFPLQQ